MELNAQTVTDTVCACIFDDGIPREKMEAIAVRAMGVRANVGFDPVKLERNKPKIREMLAELPDEFRQEDGGSFLNMCIDRHGRLWTGDHARMDALLCLGLAANLVQVIPRELWPYLPGHMPLVRIVQEEQEQDA